MLHNYKMLRLAIRISSPNPSLHSFTAKAKTILRGLTVKLGVFMFLQEGFYVFSQAFPRLSFSRTV